MNKRILKQQGKCRLFSYDVSREVFTSQETLKFLNDIGQM